jgi:hypothetical protein
VRFAIVRGFEAVGMTAQSRAPEFLRLAVAAVRAAQK